MGRYIIAKHGKDQGFYEFVDLDELIVNHIHAMSRRVEELMAHEKFKQGGEDELSTKSLTQRMKQVLIPLQPYF